MKPSKEPWQIELLKQISRSLTLILESAPKSEDDTYLVSDNEGRVFVKKVKDKTEQRGE